MSLSVCLCKNPRTNGEVRFRAVCVYAKTLGKVVKSGLGQNLTSPLSQGFCITALKHSLFYEAFEPDFTTFPRVHIVFYEVFELDFATKRT